MDATTSLQKPTTLKWVKGLAIFQIVIGVLIAGFLLWAVEGDLQNPFWQGFNQGLFQAIGADETATLTYEFVGEVAGIILFTLLGPIFALVAIARRSKGWAIAAMVLIAVQMVGSIVQGGSLSPLSLVILILMLTKSARAYLGVGSLSLPSKS